MVFIGITCCSPFDWMIARLRRYKFIISCDCASTYSFIVFIPSSHPSIHGSSFPDIIFRFDIAFQWKKRSWMSHLSGINGWIFSCFPHTLNIFESKSSCLGTCLHSHSHRCLIWSFKTYALTISWKKKPDTSIKLCN